MDAIIKLNSDLAGLPSGVLVMLFAVALGYLLKSLAIFPNRYIPLVVIGFCTLGFMVIAPARPADMAARIYHGRNFLIGFILGFAAWTFHAQILKRWVDPKIFNDNQTQIKP